MNPLDQYPAIRRALYTVQWILNGASVVLGAFFAATGTAVDALPQWYVVCLAVLPVLWTYLGLTAAANTPAPPQHRGEGGYLSITWPASSDPDGMTSLMALRARLRNDGQRGAV